MSNHPIIKITTPFHTVVYLQGIKFAEGHSIIYSKWIQLGMIMIQMNLNMSHIQKVFIGFDNNFNNDFDILDYEFPDKINDLSEDIKQLVFGENIVEQSTPEQPQPTPEPNENVNNN